MNQLIANGACQEEKQYLKPKSASAAFQFLAFGYPDYKPIDISLRDPAWKQLSSSYDDLPIDAYLPAGETYRSRRFGRFGYNTDTNELTTLPDGPFFQDKIFNRLNGGIQREFAPLAPATRQNPILYKLIRFHAAQVAEVYPYSARWKVFVHQVRIIGGGDGPGKPTPEGIHQDGHHFVAQILVARENVIGAQSLIYDRRKEIIACTTLRNALDSLLVNDKAVFHQVTELYCKARDERSYRDMLLLDFNPYDESGKS